MDRWIDGSMMMRWTVRRFLIFSVLAAVIGGATLHAQDVRIQARQTIVVPHEVVEEIQRVIRQVISDDMLRDLSRDLGQAMREVGRDFGKDFGREFGRAFEQVNSQMKTGPVRGGTFIQDRDFKAEATDKQTKTLAIGANGSLEIKNIIGDITITTGGSREATVEIVRTSKGRTDADAKLGLERVTASVTTRSERGLIEVKYPEERRPNYYVSVAFNVKAPAGTGILVNTITGDVTLSGIKGETSVNTTTGSIDISQASALTHAHTVTGKLSVRDSQGDAMDLGTMNGTMTLTNIKAKQLELSSVTGPVTAHDIQAVRAEATCMSCSIEYSGPVASGGRYEFTAHNGEIRLGLSGGFDFEGQSFSGQVEADPSLGLKAAGGSERVGYGPRRRTVTGTVGGGGGTVEATTFSGSIKIGRKVPEASPAKGRAGGSKK
jgi:DUF4097 and DUF4098 domain-containing protein YvlB